MNPEQAENARRNLIALLAGDAGRDATSLAREIGRKNGYVRDFLNGRKESLGAHEVLSIERIYRLPAGALLGGLPMEELRRVPVEETFEPDPPEELDENAQIAVQAFRKQLSAGVIPERDVVGGLGEGGDIERIVVDGEELDGVRAWWRLPPEFIRYQLHAKQADLDFIPVDGDSMEPTLTPGDRVLVNRGHIEPSPDGLYAIHNGVGVVIKRLEIVFGTANPLQVKVISDNPKHGSYLVPMIDLKVIGRVICRVTQC